ncbi:MAG: hypothetical protein ACKVOJ_06725 [Sphingomonadaceae bacterium]
MDTTTLYLLLATTGLLAIAFTSLVGLRAVAMWIELKRTELQLDRAPASPSAHNRIELADLKERLRKLEAIAAGVDL